MKNCLQSIGLLTAKDGKVPERIVCKEPLMRSEKSNALSPRSARESDRRNSIIRVTTYSECESDT
jgi:hypothetical protein